MNQFINNEDIKPVIPTLSFNEIRVLGVLIEKSMTTPDQMPLSLNACVLGCNQSSNRDPVTSLEEEEVELALESLQVQHLILRAHPAGARAPKYAPNMGMQMKLEESSLCLLYLLMVRGAQTPGELSTRCKRACPDLSLGEIQELLGHLGSRGFVEKLPRLPGQKESRWSHLLSPSENLESEDVPTPAQNPSPLEERVQTLEEENLKNQNEISQLKAELDEIKTLLEG